MAARLLVRTPRGSKWALYVAGESAGSDTGEWPSFEPRRYTGDRGGMETSSTLVSWPTLGAPRRLGFNIMREPWNGSEKLRTCAKTEIAYREGEDRHQPPAEASSKPD